MYHLPHTETWDPPRLASALSEHGVTVVDVDDSISIVLPIQMIDIDRIISAKDAADLQPQVVGETSATLAFVPEAILENIVLAFSASFADRQYPRTNDVTAAILSCGYDSGSESELAKKHYAGDVDLEPIFARIDDLQTAKEQAVAECRFADAKMCLEEQRPLREQIESLLAESFRHG